MIPNKKNKVLGQFNPKKILDKYSGRRTPKEEFCINGVHYLVNISSTRIRTLKSNRSCASCGIEITHCFLEESPTQERSFQFYHIDKEGNKILMTKDHIIPKSKGGTESANNLQTMCILCNAKKGNTLEKVSIHRKRRATVFVVTDEELTTDIMKFLSNKEVKQIATNVPQP